MSMATEFREAALHLSSFVVGINCLKICWNTALVWFLSCHQSPCTQNEQHQNPYLQQSVQELLLSFNTTLVSQFFREIGPAEAACMCFAIASCSAAVATPAALVAPMLPISAKPAVADRAVSCLSDPQYTGTASWPSTEVGSPSCPALQYSLVYPATCDPARLGRISARTELEISACIARLWFDLVSFGPVLREDRINEDRVNKAIL
jgi:hypothetical protein